MHNEAEVRCQIEQVVGELRSRDLPLRVDGRKHTCGPKGKGWYKLYEWRPDAGGVFITGSFGSYKTGEWQKVLLDTSALSEAEKARRQRERESREAAARAEREREAGWAAKSAAEQWRAAQPHGESAYLQRKLVVGEACRYLADGSIVIPLLRYDLPREQALRGVQRIFGDGRKLFTRGFEKPGACTRLGHVVVGEPVLVCEGYATGLTLRMAIGGRLPVFVALDAGNLLPAVQMLRALHPQCPILICADDDWRTRDQRGEPMNPGRDKARAAMRATPDTHMIFPVFSGLVRGDKDTDFNDLHARAGLNAVARQLRTPLQYFGLRLPDPAVGVNQQEPDRAGGKHVA